MKTKTNEVVQAEMNFKEWLLANYDGKSFQYGSMIKAYKAVGRSTGDEPDGSENLHYLFLKAKNLLEKECMIKRIKHGWYFISSEGVDDVEEEDADEDLSEQSYISSSTRVLGSGSSEVYVYTYPGYPELARLKGDSEYRLKIGMTTIGHDLRFKTSSHTDEPEYREVLLIINTDHPEQLEKMIHAILDMSGHKLEDTPGREWYRSSPEAIVSIYHSLQDMITITDSSLESDILSLGFE